MGQSSKPRKKYKPRESLIDPVNYVLGGIKLMGDASASQTRLLRVINHGAIEALRTGKATTRDMTTLANAANVAVALMQTHGFGKEYREELASFSAAVVCISRRGHETRRYIGTGPELQAVNVGMEVHDAQLDITTVGEMATTLPKVKSAAQAGRMISC